MEHADMDARKQDLRRSYRHLRTGLGAERRGQADDRIQNQVFALPEYKDAEVVLTYLDVGAEVRTRGIVQKAWEDKKIVAVPYCVPNSRQMRWYAIDSFEGLVRSRFGVDEPNPTTAREQPVNTGQRMLALVPGLTFDAHGYRLGYGGGFYDTFLSSFWGFSVGLCREEQMNADLRAHGVVDSFDIPVNVVVTDRAVYTCNATEECNN